MLLLVLAASTWVLTSHYDRMRERTTSTATLEASSAPANGPRALLMVSERDGQGFAGLAITGGRLDCIVRCLLLVKFGVEPARYVRASSTSPNALIFDTAALDPIRAAREILIEVRFLRGGSYQYRFNASAPLAP